MIFGQDVGPKFYTDTVTESLTDQSQNRDFLITDQKVGRCSRRGAHTCEGDIGRNLVHYGDLQHKRGLSVHGDDPRGKNTYHMSSSGHRALHRWSEQVSREEDETLFR